MEHSSMRGGRIGRMEVRNRFVYPAMVANYCTAEGEVTERFIAYHRERAAGGVGLIVLEASMIMPEGRSFPRQLALHDDRFLPGLERLTAAVHSAGARIAVQLYHPGRQTSAALCGRMPVAPSNTEYDGGKARALTKEEMEGIVRAFGEAALRVRKAGFDAVEIHAGNGYLLQQFHSRFTNHRTDEYGGALGCRTRFSVEVIREIRRLAGDIPLIVRLGVAEPVEKGLTPYEGVAIARILAREDIDALHVTAGMREGGELVTPPACMPHGTHMAYARMVKEAVGGRIPVIGIGRVNSVACADAALDAGHADFVTMGRALIAEPHLIEKTLSGRTADIAPCLACNEGCIGRLSKGEEIACVINPRMGREYEGTPAAAEKRERIVVVGAGPAGCEAACAAAGRGHEVILFEKEQAAGGRVRVAALPPFKQPLSAYAEYLDGMVRRSGVRCLFGETADAEKIAALNPDRVIVAVGAAPLLPSLPGLVEHGFLFAEDVLLSDRSELPEQITVLGGGMVGAEVAEMLAEEGRSVTIVEMRSSVASDVEPRSRKMLLGRLEQLGVVLKTDAKVVSVEKDGVMLQCEGRMEMLAPAGALVLALGYRAEHGLTAELEKLGLAVEEVGDAGQAADIMTAVRQGFDAGRK